MLSDTLTIARDHDPGLAGPLLDKENTASGVWPDTAYRSKKNKAHLARNDDRHRTRDDQNRHGQPRLQLEGSKNLGESRLM